MTEKTLWWRLIEFLTGWELTFETTNERRFNRKRPK